MDFSNTRTAVLLRVGLLTLNIFVLAYLIFNDGFFVTELVLFILMGLQVISLIKTLERNNQELIHFLESIRHDDLSYSYKTDSQNEDTNKLNAELNKVLKDLREVRKEKEADFQYLKNIVQHVGIGLITFNKAGAVQIMNTAAKKLLRINNIENVKDLGAISENLVDIFLRLRTGGRDLIRLEIGGDIVQLAIYAIELTLRGEEFKLVSVQNIQNELEEKEMEAWQNLVKVLTHEIMNSVTPISSLANTVEEELKLQLHNDQEVSHISSEEIADIHLAIQTIKKRSQGLIRFVQDFRNLTHIPKPKISEIKVRPLLEEMLMLLKREIEDNHIKANIRVDPENLTINADKELIEQVLINLIKNAAQAFDEQTNRLVELKAYVDEKSRPVISVRDNGNGIDDEALEKIFIPFFTTKKSGSGIGLSLSRQIMRQHQGMLGVKSKLDEGTEFFLRF
ncbi:response regulator receiver domain protein [Fulvivirga imtechensis AK7]|uniref:histidine kinase n=1 Tax=Fulvivirga imtechensis AK7 TaxID=1237149 RepID=L8JZK2_9BACT|nr:ATP-binding protein [Fulvivirga imtechensis]ELR73094.1 response regulator receiver domain protein [Fulvivirga imtechensis AK7]